LFRNPPGNWMQPRTAATRENNSLHHFSYQTTA
jgi:hypothetical protein